jgi:lipoate-protein ligase A
VGGGRLLETWDGAAGLNLAIDEALLLHGGEDLVLRFYSWRPAALSLGYFQRADDVAPAALGLPLARRMTGGGAIWHSGELTYSIAAPAGHALFRGSVEESYRRIHAAIAAALAALGAFAELRGARALESDRPGTGMCFHASSALDLVLGGRKLAGSAQRRIRGRVLHHGSLKLAPNLHEPGIAALADAGLALAPAALVAPIAAALARAAGMDAAAWTRDAPRPAELEHARARAAHFAAPHLCGRG